MRALGYEVCGITASGEEATALARQQGPGLVLMDIHLDGAMDGVQAAEIIRRECKIPVIYLTAHPGCLAIEGADPGEPFACILKPFDEFELEGHISKAFSTHHVE